MLQQENQKEKVNEWRDHSGSMKGLFSASKPPQSPSVSLLSGLLAHT